jgi:hypothetical protein
MRGVSADRVEALYAVKCPKVTLVLSLKKPLSLIQRSLRRNGVIGRYSRRTATRRRHSALSGIVVPASARLCSTACHRDGLTLIYQLPFS